jgi:signal transduction histidine kinase
MNEFMAPDKAPAATRGPLLDEPTRARVLVVDDDERSNFAVQQALEGLGHEVVVAHSGPDALRHLLVDDYAVILLDLHMPGMDGYETAALIRSRKRSRDVPIVFLTGVFRDEAHVFQAYTAGAVDVVFKPVDPFVLRSKVSVLVELRMKTLEVERQARQREQLLEQTNRALIEKQAAEEALLFTQQRERAILESLPVAVMSRAVASPHPVMFASDSIERLTGFPPARFLEDPEFVFGQVHPEDCEQLRQALAGAGAHGGYVCEFRWRCPDGTFRYLLDQGLVAGTGDSAHGELISTLIDATDRHSLEEQLAQARRMEAVGQLTGGVAHDFNNLLTVIFGNLDRLSRNAGNDDQRAQRLRAMRHAAERGRSLTRQLLAFSRRQHLSPVTLDVNDLIRAFVPLIEHAVGEAVLIEQRLSDERPFSYVDPAQLENALLNLAVNARDAMPGGGVLTLATAMVDSPEEAGVEPLPGRWIRIEVIDSGSGMPKDVVDRAFEPFFTTKEVGQGSGLGLSQVYGFVRQSGGQIAIDSSPGEGTTIRLYVRASEPPVPERAEPRPAEARSLRGSERLLVVEDDPAVLSLAVDMLTDLGYQVVTARDAASALDILGRGEAVDLLFSDVIIPGGVNGVQLARAARRLRPGIAVLLASGYTSEITEIFHEDLEGDFELIDKPYERAAVATKLRELLDNKAVGGVPDTRVTASPSPPMD